LADEAECESVLKDVGIWSGIVGNDGLDAEMDAQNLSQGQKQLFSLARAILRARAKAKLLPSLGGEDKTDPRGLLLLDEVSSNVDIHTDKVMQEIIRREFKEYTVIAVAHRLETVMYFDRVMVMENEEIIKSGPPTEVFQEIDANHAFD
jgi:ATP-binding cassette, subfamily C (CFTR/MRP), member 1